MMCIHLSRCLVVKRGDGDRGMRSSGDNVTEKWDMHH